MFICLCLCILHAAYLQMGANWCKCKFCCTSGIANTDTSTKAAFNLSNKNYSTSVHTHSECNPVRSIRGAAISV